MEDNEGNNFSIPNDDEVVQPEQVGRRVKPRPKVVHEEPPVIFVEDEMPIDLYNRAMSQYQDNIGKGLNYQNMHTDLLFRYMQISRPYGYPTYYPYISN